MPRRQRPPALTPWRMLRTPPRTTPPRTPPSALGRRRAWASAPQLASADDAPQLAPCSRLLAPCSRKPEARGGSAKRTSYTFCTSRDDWVRLCDVLPRFAGRPGTGRQALRASDAPSCAAERLRPWGAPLTTRRPSAGRPGGAQGVLVASWPAAPLAPCAPAGAPGRCGRNVRFAPVRGLCPICPGMGILGRHDEKSGRLIKTANSQEPLSCSTQS